MLERRVQATVDQQTSESWTRASKVGRWKCAHRTTHHKNVRLVLGEVEVASCAQNSRQDVLCIAQVFGQ